MTPNKTNTSERFEDEAGDSYGGCQPIAVISGACRFPKSPSLDRFWRNIADGVELATRLDDRKPDREGRCFVPAASIVEQADHFDADFFGYSAQEAESIDPQQRIFLTIAWEALDSAGYGKDLSERLVGVFGASRMSTYQLPERDNLTDIASPRVFQRLIGNDKDYLASRISYKLGLTGPAMTVQTACSSSLVAVHLACEHIRNGECEMALAGGVGISFPQNGGYYHHEGMIFSEDGKCRPYDADAQGTVIGNGAGIVLLKALDDAVADGDPILAVIRGSAVNNDGHDKVGFTAPSVDGQADVIREALGMAEVPASSIGLVEGHGTATPLGDPIEVEALRRVYHAETDRAAFCALGSVKSNLGHADTAAGIASLLKAVMAVHHGQIPPSLHFERPNPQIDLPNSPFYVPQMLMPWTGDEDTPRRAAVSSFGVGGTNCHMILEAPPIRDADADHYDGALSLMLSAPSLPALHRTARRYGDWLGDCDDGTVTTAVSTLAARTPFPCRLAVAGRDVLDLADHLLAFSEDRHKELPVHVSYERQTPGRVAFLFTGQGSQQPGMGQDLYASDKAFRASYDRCARAVREHLDVDLVETMLSASEHMLDPVLCQPALVAFEYAMANSWRAAGIEPDAVMGHSLGEIAAAAFAGIIEPEDAILLAIVRAQQVAALPEKGAMAVLRTDRDTVLRLLAENGDPQLAVAADNGPDNIAIAGPVPALEAVLAMAAQKDIGGQLLATSHAFHSPVLEPVASDYLAIAEKIEHRSSDVDFYSARTGRLETVLTPSHWVSHLLGEVKFAETMRLLTTDGIRTFIEVGPAATLSAMGPRCVAGCDDLEWIVSRRQNEDEIVTHALARSALTLTGLKLVGRSGQGNGHRVHLPPVVLDEKPYWNPIPAIDAREPMPRDVPEQAAVHADEEFQPEAWENAIRSGLHAAENGSGSVDLDQVHSDEAGVDMLHAVYVGEAFRALGCFADPDDRWTLGELLRSTAIKPKFRQLLARLLRDLVSVGVLQKDGRHYTGFSPKDPEAVVSLLAELRRRGDDRLAGLIERGGDALADMLSGVVDPVSVIFPEGATDDVEDMYQNSRHSAYFNRIVAETIRSFVERCDGPVRLLEVGAGTGGTTFDVVHDLPAAKIAEYVFTDVGPVFLKRAREKFRDFPFMNYQTFDMEQEPAAQGFPKGHYDVILAANVLHNARDLRAMLGRLIGLLRPGGILVMREITAHKKLFDFVFGPLVPPLDDIELRGGKLFASVEGWTEAAHDAGFVDVASVPEANAPTSVLGEHVILCRASGTANIPVTIEHGVRSVADDDSLTTVQVASYADLVRELWSAAGTYALPQRQLADIHLIRPTTSCRVAADFKDGVLCLRAVETGAIQAQARAVRDAFPDMIADREIKILEVDFASGGDALDIMLGTVPDDCPAVFIRGLHRRSGRITGWTGDGADIFFCNNMKRPIMVCEGMRFATRLAEMSEWQGSIRDYLYETRWLPTSPCPTEEPVDAIVVVSDGTDLEEQLLHGGKRVLSHGIRPNEVRAAVADALELGIPVVYDCRNADIGADADAWRDRLVVPMVTLLTECRSQCRIRGGRMRIAVMTTGAVAATEIDDLSRPELSGLLGLLRVSAGEYPEIDLSLIDVDDGFDAVGIIDALAGFDAGNRALRSGTWYEERLLRCPRSVASPAPFFGGTVLITGGLSEIGLELSHWLIDGGVEHLILMGHSGMTAEREEKVGELRNRGATVTTATTDIGDPAGFSSVLDDVMSGIPRLSAIFHLAGVVEDTLLDSFDGDSFARVLRPKWQAAMTLNRLEDRLKPDLTVYFSSATTVFGPTGQAAHATANALLEGLARSRSLAGCETRAIAWGFWSQIRREERSEMAQRLEEGGMLGLETGLGLALLQDAVVGSQPVVAAMNVDWKQISQLLPSGAMPAHLSELLQHPQVGEPVAIDGSDALSRVLGASSGYRVSSLEHYLKERLGTLLQLPPDQIDPDVNLIRMGLDSLMFLDFSHQLSSELGLQITAETAFSADTIAKLAAHIDAHMPPCIETGESVVAQDIETYLCDRIAELLQIPVAELPTDRNLIQLGLDSLMFLDLAHTVSRDLGVTVSAETAFELPSIADMADHIRSLREPGGGFEAAGKPGDLIKAALPIRYRAGNGDIAPDAFADLLRAPLSDTAAVCRQRGSVRPDGGDGAPFLYAEWDKTGFDHRRFEKVWNHLVHRHDMMRAVETDDGRLEVLSDVPVYHIECMNIASSADAAKEAASADMRQEMLCREIDAGTWPRFDIRAVLSGDARVRLHLLIDNRIADTESFQVLLREMAILMHDPDTELPVLDLRCGHYLSAVEAAVESAEARQALSAWEDALSKRSDYPGLPVCDEGGRLVHPLHEIRLVPFEQWCGVRDLGREHSVTATSVIATLFGRALSEASGDDGFSIDLCYFNRLPLHAQVMNLVGDFSAMLPLELGAGHADTIREEMVQTCERIRALRALGDFSAFSIQRQGTGLSAEPGIGFTTLLGIDADYPLSETEDPVLGWPTFEQSGLSGLGLNLQALEHEQGLILTLDYDPMRYRVEQVRALADRLAELIDMLRDPAIWGKSFPSIGSGLAA